jgi:hypothetical protein
MSSPHTDNTSNGGALAAALGLALASNDSFNGNNLTDNSNSAHSDPGSSLANNDSTVNNGALATGEGINNTGQNAQNASDGSSLNNGQVASESGLINDGGTGATDGGVANTGQLIGPGGVDHVDEKAAVATNDGVAIANSAKLAGAVDSGNEIETKIRTDTTTTDSSSHDSLDFSHIHDSVITTLHDALNNSGVNQIFDINQVSSLSGNYSAGNSDVSNWGDHFDQHATTTENQPNFHAGDGAQAYDQATSHAGDAAANATSTLSAFNQSVSVGANIQYHSVNLSVIGGSGDIGVDHHAAPTT